MKAFLRLVGCGVAFAAMVVVGGDFVEASKTEAFRDGEKVLFLGDSITHGGWYVAQLQYIWQLRNPGRRATFINCGICGNRGKNGLDRFDWDVAPEKPDRIFIMFGMNDVGHGAYWNPETADAKAFAVRRRQVGVFKENMRALVAKCRAIGARVTLMTSTPYDQYSQLIEKKAVPGVNDPGICSLALATRQLAAEERTDFVDLYDVLTPILRDNPEIKFLADRVHPHEDGHLLMSAIILKASGFSPIVGEASFDAAGGVRKFTYTPEALPLPAGKHYATADKVYPLTSSLNREVVRIRNLPEGTYRLLAAGVEIGVHSAAELAKGVNIATCDTPSQRKAKDGLKRLLEYKRLASGLRGLPQGYVQIMKRGGDINDQASAFAKLDEWVEELRKANLSGGHYYRYYGGEVKKFKELYPKRDAEKARLEKLREALLEFCRPEEFELSVEPNV